MSQLTVKKMNRQHKEKMTQWVCLLKGQKSFTEANYIGGDGGRASFLGNQSLFYFFLHTEK